MADYIISNEFKTMEEIWDDLLRLHWDYLDTEENMEKLKMRRKLEDELKEFLSIVQHDRKFFLTETAHVFKQSVLQLDQFSAYKALIGFEAISQYANNLFRKPWRKEYRCIKLYSGYYHHEVKANLIDAEKMFEAMGYNLLPNHTLILEGPICPDQVTNVSRDAMTAYVECQIMKQIFQGLIAMQVQTTWQEIFEFRETHTGTASQAIKAMAYTIEKRRHRKDRQYDGIHTAVAAAAAATLDRNNGYHMGMYHQPGMYSASSNRYPLQATMAFPDHHYSQVGGYERGENFVETTCCHQNPHYECLNNFNSRTSIQKSKNGATDYSNCNFTK